MGFVDMPEETTELPTAEITSAPVKLAERWRTPCFEKLNKLDWPAAFHASAFGVTIGVRASNIDLLQTLAERLPPYATLCGSDGCDAVLSVIQGGREPGSRTRKYHLAYLNHSVIGRSHRLENVFDSFDSFFNIMIAALSPSRVFVHAGAVAWRGKAIVVPGPSMSGKSSLIKELVDAGATYLSDEYAILDKNGFAEPLERPIAMRVNGSFKQTDIPLSSMKEKIARQPYPVGLVVGTRFRESAKWRPKKMAPGQGVLLMLSNSPGSRINTAQVLDYLRQVATRATSISSDRGDAKATAMSILDYADNLA